MKDLISIIVPVYNVKEFLNKCLISIISQTYRSIEIILVDDGSTDESGLICDMYKEKDKRIQVIHKKNGGLSDARNMGLHIAKGEYVMFIDSDDYLNIHMVEELYCSIVELKADVAICGFKRVENDNINIYEKPGITQHKVISGRQVIVDIYSGKGENTTFVAWNKIYKRELFVNNGIEYPFGRIYEDTFTTYKLLYHASKVAITEACMYYYRIRQGSIINTKITRKKCIDAIDSNTIAVADFEKWNDTQLMSMAFNYACRSAIIEYTKASQIIDICDREYCKKYILFYYKRDWNHYAKKSELSIRKVIVYKSFQLFPSIVSGIVGKVAGVI